MGLADPADEAEAVDLPRQRHLGQDGVELPPGPQHDEDVLPGDALDDLVAAVAQVVGDHHAGEDVGLDHHDGARSRPGGAAVVARHGHGG